MSSDKLPAVIALTIAGLVSTGCSVIAQATGPQIVGAGPVVTEKRSVASFSRIRAGMGVSIEIEVGPTAGVEIEAQENIAKAIETKVDAGTLSIDANTSLTTNQPIKLRITTPTLEGLAILGAADVRANKFSSKSLDLEIKGSGDIVFEGSCADLSVAIKGSGTVDLSKFRAASAEVDITGSGDVRVDVKDQLRASITGSGEIVYSGNPKVTERITGSGSVGRA